MYEPVTQLARLRVVAQRFHHRLAEALGDAAVHLALDDHRVDDVAEVVDGDELLDLHLAGVGVDLDLADVACRPDR